MYEQTEEFENSNCECSEYEEQEHEEARNAAFVVSCSAANKRVVGQMLLNLLFGYATSKVTLHTS